MIGLILFIYLFYVFLTLYFSSIYLLTYFFNRKSMFESPRRKRDYPLSMVIPCYNEEKTIVKTVESLLNSDYAPLKKIFVVDDCSTDNSYELIKGLEKKYTRVVALQTPHNTGRASGSKNYGAKFVKTELIGFTDADSIPQKNAISRMIGFFDNPQVGGASSTVLLKNRNNFIERIQAIEYIMIAFTRKLLGFLDAIYVTPGPLAIYRRELFESVGGFDEKNLTEDIEITWNFVHINKKVAMSLSSYVYTFAPETIRSWFKQRVRWNLGGLQTIRKYKKSFFEKSMLGYFILPYFVLSWSLAIFGFLFFIYRALREILFQYVFVSLSIQTKISFLTFLHVPLITYVLFLFGVFLILFSIVFISLAIYNIKEKSFKKPKLLSVLFYMFFYLLAYPFVLIISMYKYIRKKEEW